MPFEKIKSKIKPSSTKVPGAALPSLEKFNPQQERLEGIIERFERGWTGQGRPPRDRRAWGDCNMAPDIFSFVARDEAQRHGFESDVKQYQLMDVHQAAGGSRYEAFQHGFNTITIEGKPFLVDLSFSQFIGADGQLTWGPKGYSGNSSGVPNENPLAQELVNKGFVPLTDENLQEYLRITTREENRDYVTNMTAGLLGQVKTLPIGLEESDGIGPEYGLQPTG